MPSLFTKIVSFLSSYLPLFALIVCLNTFEHAWAKLAGWGLLVASAISTIIVFFFLHVQRRKVASLEISISAAVRKEGEIVGYIVTYMLAFININMNNPRELIALGILLFMLGIIHINTNMFYVNPFLSLLGYHVYEIEVSVVGRKLLLSKSPRIIPPRKLYVAESGANLYIETRD